MVNTIIHPSVDNGIKPASEGLRRGNAWLQVRGKAGKGVGQIAIRPQSRVRMHEVLETEGRAVLNRSGRAARQS